MKFIDKFKEDVGKIEGAAVMAAYIESVLIAANTYNDMTGKKATKQEDILARYFEMGE